MNINIKKIALPTKSVKVEYTPVPGFMVEIGFISNELTRKLIAECAETKFDDVNGFNFTETNMDKFAVVFCKNAIVGWSGLTGEGLAKLMLVDLEGNNIAPTDEISFTPENAHTLYMNSIPFSKWVALKAKDLSLFR